MFEVLELFRHISIDQNDLSEYFSLLNFANPEYLGTRAEFRKNYEMPILRGRDAMASDAQRETSEAKLKELGQKVNKFIIRRTNDLLSKYCSPSSPLVRPVSVLICISAGQIRACGLLCFVPPTEGSLQSFHYQPRD